MPVARLINQTPDAAEALRDRLEQEWRAPDPEARQPVLIEETVDPANRAQRRLIVIWDDWAYLSQLQRSEIIMDAYENTHPIEQVMQVTVAMGLTAQEAERMGLNYEVQ